MGKSKVILTAERGASVLAVLAPSEVADCLDVAHYPPYHVGGGVDLRPQLLYTNFMSLWGDYHVHSTYSDGKDDLSTLLAAAKDRGLKGLAITEHGLSNPSYSLAKACREREELAQLREGCGLQVYFGNEHDIVSSQGDLDITQEEWDLFELHLAGFHQFSRPKTLGEWFGWYLPCLTYAKRQPEVVRRNTASVIRCIRRYPVDVLVHLNHRMVVDLKEVGRACSDCGTMVELNVKHWDALLPDWEGLLDSGATLIVGTDAHRAADLGLAPDIIKLIADYGIEDRVANWEALPAFRSLR